MKTVLLFGGSFNPPHDGHFAIARHIYKALRADEIWMMYSLNRLKDPSIYASIEHRMEMGRIMARHYPDTPVIMSDIEETVGTNQTYFVMDELKKRHPDTHFVWIMGADNLERFPEWIKGDDIFKEFSVAIISRPGYDDMALSSGTLKKFDYLRFPDAESFDATKPGWIFISDPGISDAAQSSSALLKRLRAGETKFEGHFNDIAAYIRKNGLYGIKSPALRPPAP